MASVSETKTNLRTFLYEKVTGPIRDYCQSNDSSLSESVITPLRDLLKDIAGEAGDDDLETFFDRRDDGPQFTDREIFDRDRWPEFDDGPELDMNLVKTLVELEKAYVEVSTVLKKYDGTLVKTFFPGIIPVPKDEK
jgi:hypothetical protein